MVREIVTDLGALKVRSRRATETDTRVLQDLFDTANALRDNCIGLAAVQIGYPVNILVYRAPDSIYFTAIINPTITHTHGAMVTREEGCLSIPGTRLVDRREGIKVIHQSTLGGKYRTSSYIGIRARVIQHEMDHFKGILV